MVMPGSWKRELALDAMRSIVQARRAAIDEMPHPEVKKAQVGQPLLLVDGGDLLVHGQGSTC
jgi:hypothetical protein